MVDAPCHVRNIVGRNYAPIGITAGKMQRRAGGTCCGAGDGDASEMVVEETNMAMRGALRDCERVGG